MSIAVVFLILALVCFLIAAFAQPILPRVNLIALGLAFWVMSILFGGTRVHP
jgi:hypothetical protein